MTAAVINVKDITDQRYPTQVPPLVKVSGYAARNGVIRDEQGCTATLDFLRILKALPGSYVTRTKAALVYEDPTDGHLYVDNFMSDPGTRAVVIMTDQGTPPPVGLLMGLLPMKFSERPEAKVLANATRGLRAALGIPVIPRPKAGERGMRHVLNEAGVRNSSGKRFKIAVDLT